MPIAYTIINGCKIIKRLLLSCQALKQSLKNAYYFIFKVFKSVNTQNTFIFSLPAVYRHCGYFESYYHDGYPYVVPWVYALGLTAQTGSIYCTLAVTVERYIVVCWPLR